MGRHASSQGEEERGWSGEVKGKQSQRDGSSQAAGDAWHGGGGMSEPRATATAKGGRKGSRLLTGQKSSGPVR
jgi:hypothetical protein